MKKLNNINLQFNDGVIIKLSTSSFLFKDSTLFNNINNINTDEDENITTELSLTLLIPILYPSSYVLDDNNLFYFNNKKDLSFMFTLMPNKFIDLCNFLDIIAYNNTESPQQNTTSILEVDKIKIFSKEFILYIMKYINNDIQMSSLLSIKYFMQSEIRSIINYINNASNNLSHENEIMCCTPEFYFLYLTKHIESIFKYNRIDIYDAHAYKPFYYEYIYIYNNQLTYTIKQTQQYKDYIIDSCKTKYYRYDEPNCLIDILREIIKKDTNYNQHMDSNMYDKHYTILGMAIHLGCNLQVIDYLVSHGADINLKDYFGYTSLHMAVLTNNNDIKLVQYLLEHGADINAIGNYNNSVLYESITDAKPNLNVIKILVEHGANVNIQTNDGYTALHRILERDNADFEIIKYLVEHGTDLNLQTKNGMTCLFFACKMPNALNIVKYMVENGADINFRNKNGYNALSYALTHSEIYWYLCNR